MGNIKLTLASNDNPRSAPILRGQISPQGIDLDCFNLRPSEIFRRQLNFSEFDVSEMSMSSLLILRSQGIDTWVGLPIFTSRCFAYTDAIVRDDAGITVPAQLAGRRVGVGVTDYRHTAALWTRGILQHEFGLDPRSVRWYMERPNEMSSGGEFRLSPPAGIDLHYLPEGTEMVEMLMSGKLDAMFLVDSQGAQLGAVGSGTHNLFNVRKESARYFQKTGIFPIHHCVVVRKDIVERYPWVMLNLYSAFLEAKRVALEKTLLGAAGSTPVNSSGLDPYLDTGLIDTKNRDLLATDLYPYGVIANRGSLETIAAYCFEQGLSSRTLEPSDIFYPPTLEL